MADKDPAYFGYYAQFVHQQNMLQDTVRTSAYYNAIMGNSGNLKNTTVMDVGAGSGILSYFALKAGSKHVIAVEASEMAAKIETMEKSALNSKNSWLKDKISVIQRKVEEITQEIQVDAIISEPIGVLIVHERMMESFLHARDKFLKKGGLLMPNAGNIYLSPFSDANLWTQTKSKSRFWESDQFYGIDFSPLAKEAALEIFGQPVVGFFDQKILMAPSVRYRLDFESITMNELQHFVIPIEWQMPYTGIIHGIAGWFDIDLCGFTLNTSPASPQTHWQQVRFVLREPLAVNAYDTVTGYFKLDINQHRSYTITCELSVNGAIRKNQWNLHQQNYWFDSSPTESSLPELHGLYEPVVDDEAAMDEVADAL